MKKISTKIAWAYFWKQKDVQAVQIIAWISLVAMLFSAAAMITLFSIYNGLEGTVKKMYHAFYADLEITPVEGKFFQFPEEQIEEIKGLVEAYDYHEVVEDLVLMTYLDQQKPVKLKGVSDQWLASHEIQNFLFSGKAHWDEGEFIPVLSGLGVATDLKLDIFTFLSAPSVYYLDESTSLQGINMLSIPDYPLRLVGTFRIQDEFDQNYIIAPIEKVRDVFEQDTSTFTSIEINGIASKYKLKQTKQALQDLVGDSFQVKDRYQQNQTLYWIMQSEKWAIYAILVMVMIIASFNMIGSISMLILEKKQDIFILRSMGITNRQLFWTFLKLGILVTTIGATLGILLGYLLCLGQIYFGWISFPDGFVVQAFPVAFHWFDFVLVLGSCIFIGGIAALFPSLTIHNNEDDNLRLRK
ncbi:MAG TPA: FtsX-like permease family protein [Chitinophagaceae bacterium]|nr:FtsX-like permease family protein [Chitinophagaceae bacterium]